MTPAFATTRVLNLIKREGREAFLVMSEAGAKDWALGVNSGPQITRKRVFAYLGKPASIDQMAVLGLQGAATEGTRTAYISARQLQGGKQITLSLSDLTPGTRLEIDGQQWSLQYQHTYTSQGRPIIYQFTLSKVQGAYE